LFFNGSAQIGREGAKEQIRRIATMTELTGNPGFAPPRAGQTSSRQCGIAIEWIATAALTVSLIIAATAVSMGERSLARDHFVEQPAQMPLPPL
jgi:hypothetical protein